MEAGRCVIVRRHGDGSETDLIKPPYSARSRVHEYGGGEYAVANGRIVFVNDADQDLYLVTGVEIKRLTEAANLRFADMAFDPSMNRIYAVAERHGNYGSEPQNTIAAVQAAEPKSGVVIDLLAGRDFYATPRPSPLGDRVAWLAWDLPHMPWQAAELWVGEVSAHGGISEAAKIAGGEGMGAFQPEWASDGALYFIAERNGWSNLHVWRDGRAEVVAKVDAEFTRPLWSFGMTSYAIVEPGRLIATCWRDGVIEIGIADERSATWTPLKSEFTRIDDIAASNETIAINGGNDLMPARIHIVAANRLSPQIDVATPPPLSTDYVSRPRAIAAPSPSGVVHALYFPPTNGRWKGEDATLPPLVVSAHGGPTGMARRGFGLDRQFWTTRGFAFLDVDYRGSTGYGRAYREALDGRWGESDYEDAVIAARFAAETGLADPERIVIRGSSAGGLTVLNALIHSDIFAAGASYYGVSDLVRLAADTHKFESGYLDSLIGGPPDTIPGVYHARSPVHHADHITAPVIFFQGLDDAVVPPGQSRSMAHSLEQRGVPVALLEFEGEGHGFRRAETIRQTFAAEYCFYARILALMPDEILPEIEIKNFKPQQ